MLLYTVHVPKVYEPTTLEEAAGLLSRYGESATVVAGGTAVAILLRQRLLEPEALVSLHRIPSLRDVELIDDEIRLGGLVTHHDVASSPLVQREAPALAQSFAVVGNTRVRSVATVGGVLAEADYASDPPCALLGLDAKVIVRGPEGRRAIPLDGFFLGFYETALAPDEIITSVNVPLPGPGTRTAYRKVRTRSSEDRPCVGVFALFVSSRDGVCTELRVAVGAATETPQRLRHVEDRVRGTSVTPARIAEVADTYADELDVLDDSRGSARYRREMIRVWITRTVSQLTETAHPPADQRPRVVDSGATNRPSSPRR
jgi:carbon-monoxide dehydrogenase medium subunit